MKDKFRESFEVIRSDVLRASYGQNPWQDKDQVITSVSWVSRVDDAKDSLLRSRWDLISDGSWHDLRCLLDAGKDDTDASVVSSEGGKALRHVPITFVASPSIGHPSQDRKTALPSDARCLTATALGLPEIARYAPPRLRRRERSDVVDWTAATSGGRA